MAVPEHSPIGGDLREDMAEQIATNPAYREAHFDMVNGLQAEVERLREALRWVKEYGTREGDLLDGHDESMRNIARNALDA